MGQYARVLTRARVLALASFLALGALVSLRYRQGVMQVDIATNAQRTVASTENLVSIAEDADSAATRYVLTGDDASLAPRVQGALDFPKQVALLQSVSADATQQARVAEFIALVTHEISLADATIAVRRDSGFDAARRAVLTSDDRTTLDSMRTAGDRLIAGARQRAADERAATRQSRALTGYLMLASFAFAVAMLIHAGLTVRRELRRRGEAERELGRAFREVEGVVAFRTQELVRINAQLESNEGRLKLITEFGLVHLFTATREGAAEYLTSGFATLTGLHAGRTLGTGWLDAVHPDDRAPLMEAWHTQVAAGAPVEADLRLGTADGSYRWFKLRAMSAGREGERASQWVGAMIDIHDQHEAAAVRAELLRREQAARADAERANRTKDDLLAAVSHELRTPLNAIVGWTHLLKANIGDPVRAVDAIDRNARVQARLIDDLLDVSRLMRGRFTLELSQLNLRQTVEAAIATVSSEASAKGVKIQVLGEDDLRMTGDENRLQQVVWNLLSNAVKYTPNGGRVTVTIARQADAANLTVTDTGEGIDAALIGQVFEPFRQGVKRTTRTGLGLGLAIVKQVVELHGGSVEVESPGAQQGTSFTVVLPLGDGAPKAAEPASQTKAAPMGLRVLLVEDDEDSAITLGAVLTDRGCQVRIARTAQECLDIFDVWPPDLLLCDIGLPDGDGYSLLRRVREHSVGPQRVPAIALTAFTRDEDRAHALRAGFTAHVSKPFEPDRLFDEIIHAVATH